MDIVECAGIACEALEVDGTYALVLLSGAAAAGNCLTIEGVVEVVVTDIVDIIAECALNVKAFDGVDVGIPFAVENIVEELACVVCEGTGGVGCRPCA